jgi:hypothetical protein
MDSKKYTLKTSKSVISTKLIKMKEYLQTYYFYILLNIMEVYLSALINLMERLIGSIGKLCTLHRK